MNEQQWDDRDQRGAHIHRHHPGHRKRAVEKRTERRCTGSQWQLATLDEVERRCSRDEALARMFARYVECAAHDTPVHEWPVES